MGIETKISWTDCTWNVGVGCNKVSPGCAYCYMMRDGERWNKDRNGNVVRTKPATFNLPLKLKKPSKIFLSSLTDLFHPAIDSYRAEVWDIVRKTPQHAYQILTKRPERIREALPADWGEGYPNVWLGVSVENQAMATKRIPILASIPAKVRFLSCEPLLSEINFWVTPEDEKYSDYNMLTGKMLEKDYPIGKEVEVTGKIHWVIVGGESGFGKIPEDPNVKWKYRACEFAWITNIVNHCKTDGVAVFVKQLGTDLAKRHSMSDNAGTDINHFPPHLQIQQFPHGIE